MYVLIPHTPTISSYGMVVSKRHIYILCVVKLTEFWRISHYNVHIKRICIYINKTSFIYVFLFKLLDFVVFLMY